MNYEQQKDNILKLPFDEMILIYSIGKHRIFAYRPSKLSKRFEQYDINTNFQIFLQILDNPPFRPNHLRMLIDLKLRAREIKDSVNDLLIAFDKIFYGDDPINAISKLYSYDFKQFLNPIEITAVLSQLFMIEQNIGYGTRSTFNPPSLYLHGWIRTFISSNQEIDQIVYRIARNTPPAIKYTMQDNLNHRNYNSSRKELWYLSKD